MSTRRQQMEALIAALGRVGHEPPDLRSALAALPPVGTLPPPQMTWALFGLVYHLDVMAWGHRLFKERVRPLRFKSTHKDGTPRPAPHTGVVPGLPEWEFDLINYMFDRLTNRVTGECIELYEEAGIDARFSGLKEFAAFIASCRQPNPTQQRLAQLFPQGHGLSIPLPLLEGAVPGVIKQEGRDFRLGSSQDEQELVRAFLNAWNDPARQLWLAALVGDWPQAHDLARSQRQSSIVRLTAARAEKSRQQWLDLLRRWIECAGLTIDALRALAVSRAEDLNDYVNQALKSSPPLASALGLIIEDPSWCQWVFALFRSEVAVSDYSKCAQRVEQYLSYLARHSYRIGDCIRLLRKKEDCPWTRILGLAEEHEPGMVQGLLRSALRASMSEREAITFALRYQPEQLFNLLPQVAKFEDNEARLMAAAILAQLNDSWSWRVLLEALRSTRDYFQTEEVREALSECPHPEAEEALQLWKHGNPTPGLDDNCGTSYWIDGGVAVAFRQEMENIFEAVLRVRGKLKLETNRD